MPYPQYIDYVSSLSHIGGTVPDGVLLISWQKENKSSDKQHYGFNRLSSDMVWFAFVHFLVGELTYTAKPGRVGMFNPPIGWTMNILVIL